MTIQRETPTAEGLARAIAAALKPGKHGTPEIVERFGSPNGSRAGFVVTSSDGDDAGAYYRVTVERTAVPE